MIPEDAEEIHENVVPGISERRTTGALCVPEQTSWERMVLVTWGLGLTRMVYPEAGPLQEPEVASSEAVMEKVIDFREAVLFTGEKEAMGLPVPAAGGQPVIFGSQRDVQL